MSDNAKFFLKIAALAALAVALLVGIRQLRERALYNQAHPASQTVKYDTTKAPPATPK